MVSGNWPQLVWFSCSKMSGPPCWESSSLLTRISDISGCWSLFCTLQAPEHPHCGCLSLLSWQQDGLCSQQWDPLLSRDANGCPGSSSSIIHGCPRTSCWQSWIIQQPLGQREAGKVGMGLSRSAETKHAPLPQGGHMAALTKSGFCW